MKEILMPRFDPEMKSGKIVEWLKREGDNVVKGEPVVRVDTEKVSIDVESPESGVLGKILANPGDEIAVGTPIGSVLAVGEIVQTKPTTTPISEAVRPVGELETISPVGVTPVPESESERTRGPNWLKASPAARRLAAELGVDLKYVKGTGPRERITQEDVERYSAAMKSTEASVSVIKEETRREAVAQVVPPKHEEEFEVVKLSTMRLTIAEHMVESWTKIPQVPLFLDVDLTEAEKFRAAMEKLSSKRVSLIAIVTKSLASALKQFQHLNARFEGANEIHEYQDVDVSIAVALENGLVTPVVRKANRKTATDISAEIEDLAERARLGRLSLAELRGGTTTVSNLGGFGVDSFIPIINPPQVTILGMGKSRTAPNGGVKCTFTLVFDHRATDGAEAAKLLQKVREYIESPYLLQMA